MNLYDKLVITLGNFMHEDRSLKICFRVLADGIAMAFLVAFLICCVWM